MSFSHKEDAVVARWAEARRQMEGIEEEKATEFEIKHRDTLVKMALALADAESEYRYNYQHHGAADMRTGRSWDKMRRRGDMIRAALGVMSEDDDWNER